MSENNHNYILIMAGGTGTRLYPRSREDKPKQFQKIIGDKTLIEETFDRAIKIVAPEHIYISTNTRYIPLIKKLAPGILPENFICEPLKKNTAPAMAYATAVISKRDSKAIIAVTASDHLITLLDNNTKAIKTGLKTIDADHHSILCIGIKPTFAHTGYGYIERKDSHQKVDEAIIYDVKRFVEKPDLETAQEYFESGRFYWNAAYFVWQAEYFLSEVKRLNSKLDQGLVKITEALDQPGFEEVLMQEFEKFDEEPVDTAIMEKTSRLLVLPADLGWSDVGSWDSVSEVVSPKQKDPEGNFIEGNTIAIDTENSLILNNSSDHLVATVGIKDIIVVTTDDAIVILPKGRSEEVRKIVNELKNRKMEKLL